MQTTQVARVLEDLVETLEDGNKGFSDAAEMLAEAGREDLAGTMRQMSDQRARFSTELRELAGRQGIDIAEAGSAAGAVHRGWMNVKESLSSNDADAVLSAAATGEEHAKNEFEKALEVDLPDHVMDVIRKQAVAVTTAANEILDLSDRGNS